MCVSTIGRAWPADFHFTNASSTAEATYEAVSVDDKAPEANKFVVPAELKVEDLPGPKKNVKLPF